MGDVLGGKTYVAVKAAVRAVVEETLALAGSAAASCLTEGNGTEENEEGGDELHGKGWLLWCCSVEEPWDGEYSSVLLCCLYRHQRW